MPRGGHDSGSAVLVGIAGRQCLHGDAGLLRDRARRQLQLAHLERRYQHRAVVASQSLS